jgi:hypothetical protein
MSKGETEGTRYNLLIIPMLQSVSHATCIKPSKVFETLKLLSSTQTAI